MEIGPGAAHPLGATWHGAGTRFALASEFAERVQLCLLHPSAREQRIDCFHTDGVWHLDVPDVQPGQRYGYRVDGPWSPREGHLFNPAKLLLDPYARAIVGGVDWKPGVAAFGPDGRRDDTDSAPFVPRSIVLSDVFDWDGDVRPDHRWEDTVVYEAHVKGLTARHPEVPLEQRGTYLGVAHPAVINHLLGLGVTTLELQPVHHFVHDQRLAGLGLRNYWGYNPIGWFAPHSGYARGESGRGAVHEFKTMVRALHSAGIEVVIDVVYNHTAESGLDGPVLSWRGIDHWISYRTVPGDPSRYDDVTGTGNTVAVGHPQMIRTIMDSLRYWVAEMHVDGFRFDLATALTRDHGPVDPGGSLLDAIGQDPVLARAKMIAEPWDLAPGGYLVGGFPRPWREWNDRYRDCVRDFWRRHGSLGELAARITGSADIYGGARRGPTASINFVTAHDGFTLADLVTYHHKRNEANGENNRDGESHNRSWNHGREGPTDDEDILAERDRTRRAIMATLFLSQGVPMLLAGDELSRTQGGNNNAYCQDNDISWIDWEHADSAFFMFLRRLIALRADNVVLRRNQFFDWGETRSSGISWCRLDGSAMTPDDWNDGRRSIKVVLDGPVISADTDSLLVVINGDDGRHDVRMPTGYGYWTPLLDTAVSNGAPRPRTYAPGARYRIEHRSVVVFRGELR